MKKFAAILMTVGLGFLALAPVAGATQDSNLHCPSGGVKVEANGGTQAAIDGLVLAAGTSFCVKAGPGNTGKLIADGESTLREYSPGGKNVSYYVVYETPTTTTTVPPTTTTTVPPTTTTTTAPPVTTTTVPPVVTTTTVPPVVVTTVPPVVEVPVVPVTPVPEAPVVLVAAPEGELPHTGAATNALVILGLGLVALGLALWFFSRKVS